MEKQYVAINIYDDEVWVEFARAKNFEEAEFKLGRNNAQVILGEDEVRRIFLEIQNNIDFNLQKENRVANSLCYCWTLCYGESELTHLEKIKAYKNCIKCFKNSLKKLGGKK